MKMYIKKWDNVLPEIVTNIDMEEIIDTFLSFVEDCQIMRDIFITKKDISEMLIKLKDKNTYFEKNGPLFSFNFPNISHLGVRKNIKNDGDLSFSIKIKDDGLVSSIALMFYSDWCSPVLYLYYHDVMDKYVTIRTN